MTAGNDSQIVLLKINGQKELEAAKKGIPEADKNIFVIRQDPSTRTQAFYPMNRPDEKRGFWGWFASGKWKDVWYVSPGSFDVMLEGTCKKRDFEDHEYQVQLTMTLGIGIGKDKDVRNLVQLLENKTVTTGKLAKWVKEDSSKSKLFDCLNEHLNDGKQEGGDGFEGWIRGAAMKAMKECFPGLKIDKALIGKLKEVKTEEEKRQDQERKEDSESKCRVRKTCRSADEACIILRTEQKKKDCEIDSTYEPINKIQKYENENLKLQNENLKLQNENKALKRQGQEEEPPKATQDRNASHLDASTKTWVIGGMILFALALYVGMGMGGKGFSLLPTTLEINIGSHFNHAQLPAQGSAKVSEGGSTVAYSGASKPSGGVSYERPSSEVPLEPRTRASRQEVAASAAVGAEKAVPRALGHENQAASAAEGEEKGPSPAPAPSFSRLEKRRFTSLLAPKQAAVPIKVRQQSVSEPVKPSGIPLTIVTDEPAVATGRPSGVKLKVRTSAAPIEVEPSSVPLTIVSDKPAVTKGSPSRVQLRVRTSAAPIEVEPSSVPLTIVSDEPAVTERAPSRVQLRVRTSAAPIEVEPSSVPLTIVSDKPAMTESVPSGVTLRIRTSAAPVAVVPPSVPLKIGPVAPVVAEPVPSGVPCRIRTSAAPVAVVPPSVPVTYGSVQGGMSHVAFPLMKYELSQPEVIPHFPVSGQSWGIVPQSTLGTPSSGFGGNGGKRFETVPQRAFHVPVQR